MCFLLVTHNTYRHNKEAFSSDESAMPRKIIRRFLPDLKSLLDQRSLRWLGSLYLFCPIFLALHFVPVENDDSYDELKRDAKTCLSLMSQGLL